MALVQHQPGNSDSGPEATEFGAELFEAVADGDVIRMQKALAMLDYSVDCYNGDSMSPLGLAASLGQYQVVDRLVRPFGTKPGADVDARNRGGATALMFAAWNGHKKCVEVLVQHGADVQASDDEGMTALLWAVQSDQHELVQLLMPLDFASLFSASEYGYTTLVAALLELGIPVDSLDGDGNTALLRLAMSTLHFDNENWAELDTSSAVAELLVANGADLEATDPQYEQTVLGWALKTCKPLLTDTLRELGADVEAQASQRYRVRGQTLLISTVTELLEPSAESPYDVWPLPLRVIGDKYLAGLVQQQISIGAKVEATDSAGRTCLMHAAALGAHSVLDKLLGSADVDVVDFEGQSALVYAALEGHDKAVSMLLAHGANPLVKDRTGNQLWQAAELCGHFAVSRAIQSAGGLVEPASSKQGAIEGGAAYRWE